MRFDLRHIRSFVTLAEELHFSRAAVRLRMTQPGMSRLIGELERELDVVLFRRTTRTVELTDAGKAFLTQSRIALDHFERAITIARRTASGVTGVLRIGYMDFAINGRLPELLREFNQHRPEIRLELSYIPTMKQQEALLADRIDIGFMIDSFEIAGMRNYHFDKDQYVALLPIAHPLSNVRELRLSDLAKESFILGSGDSWGAFRRRLFPIFHRLGFSPDIVQQPSSSEGIFGLVAAGVGVSVYAACARNVQRRGIVIKELADVHDFIVTSATWATPVQSPAVEAFTSFLVNSWRPA